MAGFGKRVAACFEDRLLFLHRVKSVSENSGRDFSGERRLNNESVVSINI